MTKDHCASDPDEAARIKGSGGRVITDSIGRTMVNNRLAMSRFWYAVPACNSIRFLFPDQLETLS